MAEETKDADGGDRAPFLTGGNHSMPSGEGYRYADARSEFAGRRQRDLERAGATGRSAGCRVLLRRHDQQGLCGNAAGWHVGPDQERWRPAVGQGRHHRHVQQSRVGSGQTRPERLLTTGG